MAANRDREHFATLQTVRTITDATGPAKTWKTDAAPKLENSRLITRIIAVHARKCRHPPSLDKRKADAILTSFQNEVRSIRPPVACVSSSTQCLVRWGRMTCQRSGRHRATLTLARAQHASLPFGGTMGQSWCARA